jgi:hypothetical protein
MGVCFASGAQATQCSSGHADPSSARRAAKRPLKHRQCSTPLGREPLSRVKMCQLPGVRLPMRVSWFAWSKGWVSSFALSLHLPASALPPSSLALAFSVAVFTKINAELVERNVELRQQLAHQVA